jgi:hypothetical protein
MSAARELADQIIAYGLTELTDLLPDTCILETVNDRARGDGLTKTERDQLFDDVYELVGKAAERPAGHQPRRGDEVEAWLKAERDEYAHGGLTWSAISNLIDAYRMHADASVPLGRDVSDGGQDG